MSIQPHPDTMNSSGTAMASNGMMISAMMTASTRSRPRNRMRARAYPNRLLTTRPSTTTDVLMISEFTNRRPNCARANAST